MTPEDIENFGGLPDDQGVRKAETKFGQQQK